MRIWGDEQSVYMVGRFVDSRVSAVDVLDACDMSLHAVLFSIHVGGGAEVRFVEGFLDGVAADFALPPVLPWGARSCSLMMKEVIYE